MSPKLSIIIPVFNTEEYLRRCLDSCLAQEYKNIEVIIVDDFSSGECEEIYKKYSEFDSRIKFIRHPSNLGLLQARITGIKNATGHFITHLDSDDWIGKNTYKTCIDILTHKPGNLVLFNTNCVDSNKNLISDFRSKLEHASEFITSRGLINKILLGGGKNWGWHVSWNKVWRSEFLKIQDFNLLNNQHVVMFEDVLLSLYLVSRLDQKSSCYIKNDTDGVFYYRRTDSSTTAFNSGHWHIKKLQDSLTVKESISNIFKQENFLVDDHQLKLFTQSLLEFNYPHPKYILRNPIQYFKMCKLFCDATGLNYFAKSTLKRLINKIFPNNCD